MSESKSATLSERTAALIDEQERSGKSVRSFSHERELNPGIIHYWKKKFAKGGSTKGRSHAGFIEVKVSKKKPSVSILIVFIAEDCHVEVPAGFDPSAL